MSGLPLFSVSRRSGAATQDPADGATSLTETIGFQRLGLILIAGGVMALFAPEASSKATGLILGGALTLAGVATVVQSLLAKEWEGVSWQLFSGVMELVGGVVVYLNPTKGAVGAAVLLSVILMSLGLSHIGIASKTKPETSRGWFLASGCVAIVAGVTLLLKLFATISLEPGSIVGVALLVAGVAYVAVDLISRKASVGQKQL